MEHLHEWIRNYLKNVFHVKRKRKKSVNARLSKVERLFQRVPTWLVILLVCIPFYIAGIFVDSYEAYKDSCTGSITSSNCLIHLLSVAFESAETIAILSAVVLYLKEAPDRKDKKHYEAWQVVEQAEERETSYSRYKALQDLNNDDVSLEGLDAPRADLCYIILPDANLRDADLSRSDLSRANLSGAYLIKANLEGATLEAANIQRAQLNTANLRKAILIRADLGNADLEKANLEEANLEEANLKGADLTYANLEGANISKSSLDGTNLVGANLKNVDLKNIRWSIQTTKWPDKAIVAQAKNIPESLKGHLGIVSHTHKEDEDTTNMELS